MRSSLDFVTYKHMFHLPLRCRYMWNIDFSMCIHMLRLALCMYILLYVHLCVKTDFSMYIHMLPLALCMYIHMLPLALCMYIHMLPLALCMYILLYVQLSVKLTFPCTSICYLLPFECTSSHMYSYLSNWCCYRHPHATTSRCVYVLLVYICVLHIQLTAWKFFLFFYFKAIIEVRVQEPELKTLNLSFWICNLEHPIRALNFSI